MQKIEVEINNITKPLRSQSQLQTRFRRRMLSPTAATLYNVNIRLKRQNKYLKSVIKHRILAGQEESNLITQHCEYEFKCNCSRTFY